MTNDYKDMLVAAKTEKKQAEVERCKRELKKADKRISDLTKILNKLYENVALEKITEERYQTMAPGYEREQEMLKAQREKLVAERCMRISKSSCRSSGNIRTSGNSTPMFSMN